jgi:Flp pilus assembly pilin Flp
MASNLNACVKRQNKDDNGVLRREYSLMTGFISTAWIGDALSEHGYSNTAFAKLNALCISSDLGLGELREVLAPHEEMQYAQLWHAIVSFVLMAIILAHIYIGTVGMEGAYDAMGSGDVEEQWAREHHSIWVDEVMAEKQAASKGATPAE